MDVPRCGSADFGSVVLVPWATANLMGVLRWAPDLLAAL